jgi:predicted dehydrogenase
MAPDEAGCRRIHRAVKEAGVMLAVCHVLRYTAVTQRIKQLIDQGAVGDIVSVQRLEPVGYWHQAHSFVRGNWRNETESSFMLLAKSCHDLDWIRHIMGVSCQSLASFGSLKHFKKEEQPEGASDRCLDCQIEPECPYSAKKIYLGRVAQGQTGWPTNVLTPNVTKESVLQALRTGSYGRCVYDCDNDVVDNQIVNMQFEGGRTASFTMTAFNQAGHRKTHIFGTKGELYGDGTKIQHFDFLTDKTKEIDTSATDASLLGGHGGGDYGIMNSFVDAVAHNDPSRVLSGADESLETHRMVFAAEKARREHRVVDL